MTAGQLLASVALGCCAVAALHGQDANPSALSAAQRDSLERGLAVMRVEPRASSPWPAVTIYLWVDASPEEAAAVFTDYSAHASYIPTATKSVVSRVVDSATAEVDYSIDIPIFPDEEYTVRDRIARAGSTGYRVDWTLVRASSTKASVGHALFTPWANGRTRRAGTLLEYYSFVTPGSRLAALSFIKSRSIAQIRETAVSVARRAETERGRESSMRPRLTALRSAVGP